MLDIKKRDIGEGDMLYGERIELVRIISNPENTDLMKIKKIIKLLHDREITADEATLYVDYVTDIINGINGWLQREKEECYVPPTADQTNAGIDKLAEDVGDMGGVVQIANDRGWTFEQVMNLPYNEVFTIWKVQAANIKYERRFEELIKRKSHGKGRS